MSRRKFAIAKKLSAETGWTFLPRAEYFRLKKLHQLPWQTGANPPEKSGDAPKIARPHKRRKSKANRKSSCKTRKLSTFTVYKNGEEAGEIQGYSAMDAQRKAEKEFHSKKILVAEISENFA